MCGVYAGGPHTLHSDITDEEYNDWLAQMDRCDLDVLTIRDVEHKIKKFRQYASDKEHEAQSKRKHSRRCSCVGTPFAVGRAGLGKSLAQVPSPLPVLSVLSANGFPLTVEEQQLEDVQVAPYDRVHAAAGVADLRLPTRCAARRDNGGDNLCNTQPASHLPGTVLQRCYCSFGWLMNFCCGGRGASGPQHLGKGLPDRGPFGRSFVKVLFCLQCLSQGSHLCKDCPPLPFSPWAFTDSSLRVMVPTVLRNVLCLR